MTDANHEKRIKKIETEIVELRKQIMQIEFVSKRDHAAAQREHEAAKKEFDANDKKIQKRIDYIAKLAGITLDELDLLDEKIRTSGRGLAQPRKRSTLA